MVSQTPPPPTHPSSWQSIANRKKTEQKSLIPQEWRLSPSQLPGKEVKNVLSIPKTSGILNARELEITEQHDATSLATCIRLKRYTSLEVTIAFCKRAAIAQQVCNCLTEIFFTAAIARARELDAQFEKTGKVTGPLHGVPVSVKDTFQIRGIDTSIGIASLAESPAKDNSLLIDILLSAGAVLYCKTNVPQTLMALDSENNLFGRTLNPRNRLATAGGSSGGEGALLAMRGSILGVGTDVGGSIRIPAMCNGLYGIKPSSQRIPYKGMQSGVEAGIAKIALPASAGPMARSMRDCELFLKTVAEAKTWERDPDVAFGGWEEQGNIFLSQEKRKEKKVFGVIRTDGLITPLPPISKIIQETIDSLRKAGHDVIEISAPAFKQGQSLANGLFGIDGGNYMFDLLEKTGEPLTTWLSPRLRRKQPISLQKLRELHARKTELETEMLKIWRDPNTGKGIDAIICPVAPHPVPPMDRWNGVSYTSTFVLLDYPAGVLPVRDFMESDLIGELVDEKPLGSWDKANRELWDKKTIDRTVYLDTTLSIQVIAPKLQERRLIQAMTLIDEALHGSSAGKLKL